MHYYYCAHYYALLPLVGTSSAIGTSTTTMVHYYYQLHYYYCMLVLVASTICDYCWCAALLRYRPCPSYCYNYGAPGVGWLGPYLAPGVCAAVVHGPASRTYGAWDLGPGLCLAHRSNRWAVVPSEAARLVPSTRANYVRHC
jgi:hypothetical protein